MPARKSDAAEPGQRQLSMMAFLKKPKPNDNFVAPTAAPRKSVGAVPIDGNGAPPPTPASLAPASTAKKVLETEDKFQIATKLGATKPAFHLEAQPTPATNVAAAEAEKLSQVHVGTKRAMEDDSEDEMPKPKRKRRNSIVDSDEEMEVEAQKAAPAVQLAEPAGLLTQSSQSTSVAASHPLSFNGDIGSFGFDEEKSLYLSDGKVQLPENSQRDYISKAPKDVQDQFDKAGLTADEHAVHDLNSRKHDSQNANIPPYIAECVFFYKTTSKKKLKN